MTDKYEALRAALDGCGESDYHLHQCEEAIRALLAERDGLLEQHGRDSATLRKYAQERDDLRKERDALSKDAERLDFIETQDCWIGLIVLDDVEPIITGGGSYRQTVREAIDAAISAKGGE